MNKIPPKPVLSVEEVDKENFGLLYISLLAVKLIDLIGLKYSQIQLIGGLTPQKQLQAGLFEFLESNDQVIYEYSQSTDCAKAGAL